MKRKLLSILAAIALAVASIHPPQPAQADPAYLSITGNPLTSATAPYLILSGLVGQSACAATVNTAGGTLTVAGHYRGAAAWTSAITTTLVTDGTTSQASQTATGSYAFNCSGMDMVRVDGTSATGTPSVTLTAAGGVSKILGRSGGSGSITGTAPITATTTAGVTTVGLTTPLAWTYGGTGATNFSGGYCVNAGFTSQLETSMCSAWFTAAFTIPAVGSTVTVSTTEDKVFMIKEYQPISITDGANSIQGYATASVGNSNTVQVTVTAITSGAAGNTMANAAYLTFAGSGLAVSATPTPISVQAGTGTAVATPSPGVFVVSNTGVTSVTGTGNISSTGGTTPVVSMTSAPTFASAFVTSLGTSSNCLKTTGSSQIATTGAVCLGGATAASFVAPAVGSTVSVSVASLSVPGMPRNNTPWTISDGTTTVSGVITAGANTTTLTFLAQSYPAGSAGATIASGANIMPGSAGLSTPVSIANGGTGTTSAVAGDCVNALSTSAYETSRCVQWSVNSFTVPAANSTVTLTANDGKLFSMPQYTPLLITDGTNVVEGYANATVTSSATVVLFATNVLFGTAGNTMAANASLSISGMGTTTASANPPNFTGGVNTGVQCVKSNTGTGGSYNLCPGYFQIVHAGGSSNVTSTMSDSSLSITSGTDGGGDISALTHHVTGLTSGRCVQSTTGGLLASASAACGTGNGTVTSVTGTANQISVATGTTTPVLSIPTNPVFPGQAAASDLYIGANTTGSVNVGLRLGSAAGAFNQSIWIACPPSNVTAECNLGGVNGDVFTAITGGNALWALDGSGNMAANSLTGTNLTAGDCLQATTNGKIVNATSGAACGTVTSVAGDGTNVSVATGTTTPVVSVTSAPTFVSTTLSGNTANTALMSNSSKQIVSDPYFAHPLTAASFVIPAVGTAVTVTLAQPVTLFMNTSVSISDGTNEASGVATATVTNATSFSFTMNTLSSGAVGNTMATAAQVSTGSNGSVKGYFINGVRQAYFHMEAFSGTAIANAAVGTFTFGKVFNAATSVTCNITPTANNAIYAGQFWISSITTTAVQVTNNTGVSQTPQVQCAGY